MNQTTQFKMEKKMTQRTQSKKKMTQMPQIEDKIERFMAIQEDAQNSLLETTSKIEPTVLQLQETTKSLQEQLDVFKNISQSAQNEMRTSIKSAAQEMAEIVTQEITEKAEKQITEVLKTLDHSVQYATRALLDTKRRKRLRLAGFFCLSCLVTGLIGVGVGLRLGQKFYSEKSGYKERARIPNEFLKEKTKTKLKLPEKKGKMG